MITDDLRIRRIEFAGSILDVEYWGDSAERVLEFLFRDQALPNSMSSSGQKAHFKYHLESDPENGVLRLYSGNVLERECVSEAEMAMHLIGLACYQLAYFSKGGLMLHAALVSRDRQGVLLPGSTGKGKSTLAAWLMRCGYDYLTDELVFIPDSEGQTGYGLVRPLNLKKAARELLSEVFQISSTSHGMMIDAYGDLVLHKLFGNGHVLAKIPICTVIFPHFQPGIAFELGRLSKAQTGFELMQCLINARNLPEHGFQQVIMLARSLPAYQMVYGDFSLVEVNIQAVLQNSSFTV